MKVKLKDLTAEQFKEWKEKECNHLYCKECQFKSVNCSVAFGWFTHKDMFSDKFLNQEVEVEVPILDNEEREFLQNFINALPKVKITYIVKYSYTYISNRSNYLRIEYTDKKDNDMFCLPRFKFNSMYKGMEIDKNYTLEELGLKQKGSN